VVESAAAAADTPCEGAERLPWRALSLRFLRTRITFVYTGATFTPANPEGSAFTSNLNFLLCQAQDKTNPSQRDTCISHCVQSWQ
jgi:hypothetical protein